MSDKAQSEGHWESHSYASQTTKVGDNPSVTIGKEASAEGSFDHGKPVVADSHATTFTDKGHPGTIEYKDQSADQQKSIK
ncbi:unnamed protein product [Adineta steineri]|uniref:Uncharacterized protein n=1 Tax=Adineta steineri TaxID=433720 RepID=A0A815A6G3_9BILA|nr:unnamed protein product [Adineta steineri]CAF1361011.1 unnamed protein product [Adineta steineri]CAF1540759.1 unnamed protein product [Adineta steineri]CAF1600117.1 unnamed protein product [Adineta steineri]